MRLPSIAFVIVLLLSGQTPAAPKPSAPRRHLPEPEHVRPGTRQQIRARMGQHVVTAENLVRAVVLLDRPTVRMLATRIADEEVVAKTSGIREKQPPVLPPRFF